MHIRTLPRLASLLVTVAICAGCGDEAGPPLPTTAARVVDEQIIDARTRDLQIESPALGAVVGVRILLPPSWSSEAGRRWPVLYVLHGAEATPRDHPPNYLTWSRQTDIVAATAGSEVLVVMPEGGNVGWYSDWYNAGSGGPPGWETFHLVELREILEQRYRANQKRAIAGLSMGGFGAASYAARHPGMFRAVAAFSSPLTMTAPFAQTVVTVSLALQGFDRGALWGDPVLQAEIWAAHDPYTLAPNLVDIPVFVSCGNGNPGPLDPPGRPADGLESAAYDSVRAFADHLVGLGGDVTVDLYGDGTHSWPYWEQELHRALPMLLAAVDASAARGTQSTRP